MADGRNFVYVHITCDEVSDTDSFWSFTIHLVILLQILGILPPLDCLAFQVEWLLEMRYFVIYESGNFRYCLWYFSLSSSFLLTLIFLSVLFLSTHSMFLCPLPRALFLIIYFIFFNNLYLLFLTLLVVLISVNISVVH